MSPVIAVAIKRQFFLPGQVQVIACVAMTEFFGEPTGPAYHHGQQHEMMGATGGDRAGADYGYHERTGATPGIISGAAQYIERIVGWLWLVMGVHQQAIFFVILGLILLTMGLLLSVEAWRRRQASRHFKSVRDSYLKELAKK